MAHLICSALVSSNSNTIRTNLGSRLSSRGACAAVLLFLSVVEAFGPDRQKARPQLDVHFRHCALRRLSILLGALCAWLYLMCCQALRLG